MVVFFTISVLYCSSFGFYQLCTNLMCFYYKQDYISLIETFPTVSRNTQAGEVIRQEVTEHVQENALSQRTDDSNLVAKARTEYRKSRTEHRKLVRLFKAKDAEKRDRTLLSDPKATFAKIKSRKRGMARKINKLRVDSKTYSGENVPDGFYDSISMLKTRNQKSLNGSSQFADFSATYESIL